MNDEGFTQRKTKRAVFVKKCKKLMNDEGFTKKNQMKIKLIKRGVNVCERSVRNWMNDEGFTQRKTK